MKKTVTMRNSDTNVRIRVNGTLVKYVEIFIYLLCIVVRGGGRHCLCRTAAAAV